ncbi:MAG: acetate/propionate family kinase [Lachnospirales bacterium]
MNILVLNCGSSSLKYQFIDMTSENVIAKGLCERIGIDGKHKYSNDKGQVVESDAELKDHNAAIKSVLDALVNGEHGVIKSLEEISGVGHRVVHGGENFASSTIITEDVKKAIEDCIDLAPLHNPPNLMGIDACTELMPNVKQVAVFDTAFHQTIEEKAYLYAIPYEMYEKYRIRRYGFHGTSHLYVSDRCAEILGKDKKDLKIITCHLGNGASICAIKNGKVVDTSMGFTPLEGLVMGTRSGDIDPAVLPFIMSKEDKTIREIENMLNKESGVLGVSGVSSDFRDIEDAAKGGNKRAQVALDLYHYRVAKYVGSYAAAMNGVDAIVFTAGLGENSKTSREEICSYLTYLGAEIDSVKNDVRGKEVVISKDGAKVPIVLVPTNEELVIARDTKKLLDK